MQAIRLTETPADAEACEALRRQPEIGLVIATPAEAIELSIRFHERANSDARHLEELTRGLRVGDVLEIPGPIAF